MIEVTLKEVAERLDKSISDIARETGLNRNTITDLFHNKVDGIKFSTIDTLCETYGLKLEDLVVRKEFRIGAAPASRIIREIRPSASPFFSWLYLNALHSPTRQFFDRGIGNVYAFFIRDGAEFYFDRREANRSARMIYEQYRRNGLDEIHQTFLRARDQLSSLIDTLSKQPLNQYVGPDLIKTFQRLTELSADFLSVSAWIDLLDFGVRDELVEQLKRAHGLSSAECSVLLASGDVTSSITRRIDLLKLAQTVLATKTSRTALDTFLTEHRDAKRFSLQYPHISLENLKEQLVAYCTHPQLIKSEFEELSQFPKSHVKTTRAILNAHNLRLNPFAFFATIASLRDEREEMSARIRFQMERILRVLAKRANLSSAGSHSLLPQELESSQSGLVSENTLKHRFEQGFLIALEQGSYRIHEGEQAVSVQDDLASRYLSQLAYEDLS